MKKIITIVVLAILSLTSVEAKMANKEGYALRHANPLPNLMRVAMTNKGELNLTQDQITKLQDWSKSNKPQMKQLVQKVMQQERALREEALTTDKNVMEKAEEMLDTRRAIMKKKTACRQNLKTILTAAQYEQVITIYKSQKGKNCKK